MQVLKPGREQQGWTIKVKCSGNGNGGGGCGALLLVSEPELFGTARHCYDGSSDYYTTMACCQCGVWTDLPDEKVPPHVVAMARKRKRLQRPS